MQSYSLDFSNINILINNKNVLITGGTGSFGHQLVKTLFTHFNPLKVIILSRDEFKQTEMAKIFPITKYPIQYIIGDVRDAKTLEMAFNNIDILFHAAALKQVPILEFNPFEAIKTNILGTQNVIETAIKCNIKKVICISTDKCVQPANLYGATKMCLERLTIGANMLGNHKTIFSVLRYGNVFGSRGSVLPLFLEQLKTNQLTITDTTMTRFNITLDSAINFVLNCASIMIGGEIFVPKLLSYNILQLTDCICTNNSKINIIGTRPGEKIHESLISNTESHLTIDNKDKYIILPSVIQNKDNYIKYYGDSFCETNWTYSSDKNVFISNSNLLSLIDNYKLTN